MQIPTKAALPDGKTIQATYEGNLPLHPNLNIKALIFPKLTNESLLSIGQLCNQGCTALFNKNIMKIYKEKDIILQGERDWKDELWKINLKNNKINYIIRQDQSKTELVQHLHACAFSPVSSTLQKCINKGNFLS